jgi:hypothetical protein
MRHEGLFDPNVDPLVPGGITEEQKRDLESRGWGRATTQYHVTNAGIGFKDDSRPGGVVLKLVDVPEGVEYLYNPDDGTAMLTACGNPTCWRYLT